MKTIYYLADTEGFKELIATNGKEAYSLPLNEDGKDLTTGVNLYNGADEDIVSNLKEQLQKMIDAGELYNMEDISRDFGDKIFQLKKDDWEGLTLLAEIKEPQAQSLKVAPKRNNMRSPKL